MQQNKVTGVVIPLIIPFYSDGILDRGGLFGLIDFQVSNGVKNVFTLSFTSESDYMDNYKKIEVANTTLEVVENIRSTGKELNVLVGVNGKTMDETLELVKHASTLPIQGIVLQPSKIEGVEDHDYLLEQVLEKSGHPLYLYENSNTAIKQLIYPDNVIKYSDMEGIPGAKFSVPIEQLVSICKITDVKDFGVYIGNAMDMFLFFNKADESWNLPIGMMSGPGNVFPKKWVKAWELRDDVFNLERAGIWGYLSVFKNIYYSMPKGEHNPKGKHTIAALKFFLYKKGIISSPAFFNQDGDIALLDKKVQNHLIKGYEQLENLLSNNSQKPLHREQ